MDYEFDVTKLRTAYRHRACRGAVFFPLLGGGWAADPADAYARVQAMWRARLVELRDAGWPGLAGVKLQGARNCPPFGLHTSRKSFHCRRPRLCPFCRAREYVLKPHAHVEHLLYGGLTGGRLVDERISLVEFKFSRRPHAVPGSDWETRARPEAIEMCRELVGSRADRRLETGHFGHRGGFMLQTVGPGDGCLNFRRAGLLVVDSRRVVTGPAHPGPGKYKERVHAAVTRKALSEAVGRVCAYPAGMLTRPAGEVIPVLDGFKGARMLTLFPRR